MKPIKLQPMQTQLAHRNSRSSSNITNSYMCFVLQAGKLDKKFAVVMFGVLNLVVEISCSRKTGSSRVMGFESIVV